MDRNVILVSGRLQWQQSSPARETWIEIELSPVGLIKGLVVSREGEVDRNGSM